MNNSAEILETLLPLIAKASDNQRIEIIDFLKESKNEMAPILKREDVAKILGVTMKRVDQLASEGKIERIYFGKKRARGYTRESVDRLTSKKISNFDEQLSKLGNMAKKEKQIRILVKNTSSVCDLDLTVE
jgi:predicted XRE-type DNA-binding protein